MLTKEKGFYKRFFTLWYVLVLNNVIVLGVNLADNIMLGNFSEEALSGAAACNQLQFLFQQIVMGFGNTVVMLGSQHWGQGNTRQIKKIGTAALIMGLCAGAALFLAASLFPRQLMLIFTDEEKIVAQGMIYLSVIRWSYPIFAMTNILLLTLRSVESVKIGFYVSVATLVVNIGLNYILIFGKLGLPAMGSAGAALATLIARAVELAVVLSYIALRDRVLLWRRQDMALPDGDTMKVYLKACLPVVLTDGLFGISTALQTVILGHLDPAAISANSVATTLYQLLKVASVGSAGAAAVIIGKTVGDGKVEKTKEYARTLQVIFLGIGALTAVLLFLLRIPIVAMYKISPEAKTLADGFLLVLCAAGAGMAYQMPVNTGIVRGGGDAKYILRLDIISIWGIVLPVSALAAFVFRWHPVAVIACLNADQVFKCIPAVIKVNRFRWMKKLT